eukprot:760622-Hanusia_phi.AAC.1
MGGHFARTILSGELGYKSRLSLSSQHGYPACRMSGQGLSLHCPTSDPATHTTLCLGGPLQPYNNSWEFRGVGWDYRCWRDGGIRRAGGKRLRVTIDYVKERHQRKPHIAARVQERGRRMVVRREGSEMRPNSAWRKVRKQVLGQTGQTWCTWVVGVHEGYRRGHSVLKG